MAVSETSLRVPLCVDLDGTLIRSDLLFESAILLLKRNPFYLVRMLIWLMRGKAIVKAEIAARVTLNAASLPYNTELVEWLQVERQSGCSLWLCTATHPALAQAVAGHLGIFDGVLASDPDRLVQRFGAGGFDNCLGRFPVRANRWRAAVRALRPHQWAKNALIVVPLLAAHGGRDLASLISVVLAVIAFCACASSVYILNDLLDLEADRAHPRKRNRPFASGDLSIAAGLAMFPLLLAVGVSLALFLPDKFQLVFAGYYALTCAYSFGLKGRAIVDAIALAGLYTIRVIAGAAAANVPLSFWLLLFSVFLFLSLAFVKRYAELDALRRRQKLRAAGRGYHVEDLAVLQSLGTSAGYLSVLVLALYINSPEVTALYARPKLIWLLCVLVLYWVSRVWMKAQRGEMHDDPVVFALKDRPSLAIGVLALITTLAAI
jgi:4-hydroxybenzoate polyprenyltransferase